MASRSKQGKRSVTKEFKESVIKSLPLSPTPSAGDLLTQEFLFQTLKVFRQEIEDFVLDLYDKIDAKIVQTKVDMIEVMSVMTDYTAEMEDKLEILEKDNLNLSSNIQTLQQQIGNIQRQLIMMNYNRKAFAIRVRGLREKEQENLKQTFVEAFNRSVGSPGLNFDWQIRRIYRQNSCVAEQQRLPRDIIIYFSTKESRNAIIQKFYNNRLCVDGQDLTVFKEIPSQMLKARRDYTFLTEELRNSKIRYKWEAPAGISVTFENQRYRLNSVPEARDFYHKILKAGLPDLPGNMERQGEGEVKQGPSSYNDGGSCSPPSGKAEERSSRN